MRERDTDWLIERQVSITKLNQPLNVTKTKPIYIYLSGSRTGSATAAEWERKGTRAWWEDGEEQRRLC